MLEKCNENEKESVPYLSLKVMALSETALKQKENNIEEYKKLSSTIVEICDKIVSVSGKDKLVARIKRLHQL